MISINLPKKPLILAFATAMMPMTGVAETIFSSQIFANFSNIQVDQSRTDTEGWQPDLKRFYLDAEHKFSDRWKLKVTTDVQWQRQQDPTDLWFRHAYAQYSFGSGNNQYLKIGTAELPWIDYVAPRVGYRYVDPSLTPKNRFAGPTDPGLHYGYKGKQFSFGVAAVTGSGYQRPTLGDQLDIEMMGVWHILPGLDLAAGLYEGTRAQDKDEKPKIHTARRHNVALSYRIKTMRLGAEYARNDNWNQVSKVPEDSSHGWSVWGSYVFKPGYSVFGRYEQTDPSNQLKPANENDYLQLGVDWKAKPYLTVALVGKQSTAKTALQETETNEIGIWTQWDF